MWNRKEPSNAETKRNYIIEIKVRKRNTKYCKVAYLAEDILMALNSWIKRLKSFECR